MSRLRRHMSYRASLSNITVTSVCSRRECTQSTVLYGSTTAVATCGQDQMVKLSLDFFAIIHTEPFKHEASKARTSTSSTSIEHHEALQASAVICKLANVVQAQVHNLLPDCIVTTCKIVGGVFLT